MYARSIQFNASAGEEILEIPEIKEAIMESIHCDTEEEFQFMKTQGIIMSVDIFTKNTRIKINDGLYNNLIENVVYSTDNMTRICSIKSEADIVGTIVFKMRGEA